MGKDKQKAKEDSFSAKTLDEKLDLLYSMIKAEAGNQRKRHDEVRKDLKNMGHDMRKLKRRVDDIENNQVNVNEEVTALQNTVTELQQAALSCDIIIKGVPVAEQHENDLVAIITAIFNKLECAALLPDVSSARRMGKKPVGNPSTKSKIRPILLKMKTDDSKQQVMKTKKAKELTCADIMVNDAAIGVATDKIYFDEHLTKKMSELFYEARKLKRAGTCDRAFFKDGCLLVQKTALI